MKTTLGEIAIEGGIQTGPFGSQLHASDYTPAGVGVVMPQDLRGNVVSLDEIAYVSPETASDMERHRLLAGDIVYSRRGDITRRALIRDDSPDLLCGTGCLRVRIDSGVADPAFVSYFLGLATVHEWLHQHAVGATMPNLNTSILSAVPIELPVLSVQRAIGEVLGALDDKIAANRRVMAVADELIRSAYETLDSDPIIRLADIAENRRDLAQPKDLTVSEKYVSLDDFDRRCIWIQRAKRGDEATSAKSIFAHGDTLFGKLRPYFHKVAIANGAGVCSTDVLVIRAKTVEDQWLVAAAASSDAAVDLAVRTSNGTRMPRADWKELSSLHVPNPRSVAARKFAAVASAVGGRVWAAIEEVESLKAARDELLPLLMSGRITVKDAERAAEDVL